MHRYAMMEEDVREGTIARHPVGTSGLLEEEQQKATWSELHEERGMLRTHAEERKPERRGEYLPQSVEVLSSASLNNFKSQVELP